jgi:hypothetical protein
MAGPNGKIQKAPQKTPTQQQQIDDLKESVKQLQLAHDRDWKKGLAEDGFRVFEWNVMTRAEKWVKTARNIGSAYVRAAKSHRDAVSNDHNHDALESQVLFSTLALLSQNPFTWVVEVKALNRLGEKLSINLKETVANVLWEGLSTFGPSVMPPNAARDAVSQEPQEFQNQLGNRVSDFKIGAHDFFAKMWDFFRTAPEESWDKVQVDRIQRMTDDWLKQANEAGILAVSAGEDRAGDERSIDEMAGEIERGFWQKWILGLNSPWQGRDGIGHNDFEAIHTGGDIADRLKKLGILREAGVEITRWHEAIEEDRPLMDWANNKYKPHPFKTD